MMAGITPHGLRGTLSVNAGPGLRRRTFAIHLLAMPRMASLFESQPGPVFQILGSRSKYSPSSFLPPSPLPTCLSEWTNSMRSIHFDHLVSELIFHTKPQRRTIHRSQMLAVHLVNQHRTLLHQVFKALRVIVNTAVPLGEDWKRALVGRISRPDPTRL